MQSDLLAENSTISTAIGSSGGAAINVSGGGTANLRNVTLVRSPGSFYSVAAWNPGTVTVEDSILSGDCFIQAGVSWSSIGGNLESPGQPTGTPHQK